MDPEISTSSIAERGILPRGNWTLMNWDLLEPYVWHVLTRPVARPIHTFPMHVEIYSTWKSDVLVIVCPSRRANLLTLDLSPMFE